jgi:hypothetical protein
VCARLLSIDGLGSRVLLKSRPCLRLIAEATVADDIDAAAVDAIVAVATNRDAAPLLGRGVGVLAVGLLALQPTTALITLLAARMDLLLGRGALDTDAGQAETESSRGDATKGAAAR